MERWTWVPKLPSLGHGCPNHRPSIVPTADYRGPKITISPASQGTDAVLLSKGESHAKQTDYSVGPYSQPLRTTWRARPGATKRRPASSYAFQIAGHHAVQKGGGLHQDKLRPNALRPRAGGDVPGRSRQMDSPPNRLL